MRAVNTVLQVLVQRSSAHRTISLHFTQGKETLSYSRITDCVDHKGLTDNDMAGHMESQVVWTDK